MLNIVITPGNIKLHQNLRKFAIQNVRNVSSFTSTWITALNAYHLKLPYIGNKSCWNVHKTLNWLLWDPYKSMLVKRTDHIVLKNQKYLEFDEKQVFTNMILGSMSIKLLWCV